MARGIRIGDWIFFSAAFIDAKAIPLNFRWLQYVVLVQTYTEVEKYVEKCFIFIYI